MTSVVPRSLTIAQLISLVKEVGEHDLARRVFSGELRIRLLSESVRVLPGLSLAERIRRGKYDWMKKENLQEEHFPVTVKQVGEWERKLFHFGRDIFSEEVIRLMKEDGFEAGAIGHILAFGEKYPKEQQRYVIVGLGSVATITGRRWVPALEGGERGRTIRRRWLGEKWGRHCRFLGVRRIQLAA